MSPRDRKRKGQTQHHITNKCRGGTKEAWNILWIYKEKHFIWHKLFKNSDLDEAIELLRRVRRLKNRQKGDSHEAFRLSD